MADTHIWNIDLAGYVIGELDKQNSVFFNGPFDPNTYVQIADLRWRNAGDMTGTINLWVFEYPNTPQENLLFSHTWENTAPGVGWQIAPINATTPNIPGLSWPIGIKLWGETEPEPGWGLAIGEAKVGGLEIPGWVLPTIAVGGLVGISYLALKKK